SLASARVLWGACEALQTARPLGPLVDIAGETHGELEWLVERGAGPVAVLAALLAELRRRPPNVLVIEDLNRADGATLDLVRLLEASAAGELPFVEEGLTSGMLRVNRDGIAFRHEIERVAIEETIPPDRRHELHGAALHALAGPPRRADLARVAHHADAAGDVGAVLEFAP